jgi:GNAT superfamily N-acetyltransferase
MRFTICLVLIERGNADDTDRLLALFDDAVEWLVARGQTGQWGSEPFSQRPGTRERVRDWAASGGLRFAVDDGVDAGAIVVGDAHDSIPPVDVPELYVLVLLTAASHRNRGVGERLIDHAADLARARGAQQLRVDCWAGVDALPAAYERLGFTRAGTFEVKGWPGAILVRRLGPPTM